MTNLRKQAVVPSEPSYRFIPLTRGQFAIVDAADFDWLNQWQWSAYWCPRNKSYYAVRRDGLRMQRVLINVPKGKVGDHWNGDTLDNRRCNLRSITQKKNSQNCGLSRNNTSGYTGVSYSKVMCKWEAFITVRGRRTILGYYDLIDDAVDTRKKAELRYYGEVIRSGCPARIFERPSVTPDRPRRSNNTSGTVGVSFHRQSGKWMARVFTGKTTRYLKLHPTREAAVQAIVAHHAPEPSAAS